MGSRTLCSGAESPFYERNRVWDGGYEWIDTKAGRLLIGKGAFNPPVNGRAVDEYAWNQRWKLREIEVTAFREFAEIEETEDDILRFANKHGNINGVGRCAVGVHGEFVMGSTWSEWLLQMRKLRAWLEVWDNIEARNAKNLRRWLHPIKVEGRTIYGFQYPALGDESELGTRFINVGLSEPEPARFSRKDVFTPARMVLKDLINESLEEFPTRALLRYSPSSTEGPFEIGFAAHHLLPILWMQFARAVAGQFRVRRCGFSGCRQYMSYERSTKRFCSDVCRVRGQKSKPSQLA